MSVGVNRDVRKTDCSLISRSIYPWRESRKLAPESVKARAGAWRYASFFRVYFACVRSYYACGRANYVRDY